MTFRIEASETRVQKKMSDSMFLDQNKIFYQKKFEIRALLTLEVRARYLRFMHNACYLHAVYFDIEKLFFKLHRTQKVMPNIILYIIFSLSMCSFLKYN